MIFDNCELNENGKCDFLCESDEVDIYEFIVSEGVVFDV